MLYYNTKQLSSSYEFGKQLFQIENEKRVFITFLKEKIMYLPFNHYFIENISCNSFSTWILTKIFQKRRFNFINNILFIHNL